MCEFKIQFKKNNALETELLKGTWVNLNQRVKELHSTGARKVTVIVLKN